MKKLIKLLLSLIIITSCFVSLSAADRQHIKLSDSRAQQISVEQINSLEEDMENIFTKYGIDIYYYYDESIPDDNIIVTADSFLQENGRGSTNVLLCINSNYYYIAVNGAAADTIKQNKTVIWDAYSDYGNYEEMIRDYYQKVVSIINLKTYEVSIPLVDNQPEVLDYANVLSDTQIANLKEELVMYENSLNISLVVVIINDEDRNGLSYQDYADDFYDYNNYKDSGALLLICLNPNYVYISTKGDGLKYIDDYDIEDILDDVCEYLPDNFEKAGIAFGQDVFKLINSGRQYDAKHGGDIDDPYIVIKQKFESKNLLYAFVGGVIITIIVTIVLTNQLKSVHNEYFARNYIIQNSFHITGMSDIYLRTSTTRSPRPKDNGGSGGGHSHGGSSHTSSSGSSHGGGGRSF